MLLTLHRLMLCRHMPHDWQARLLDTLEPKRQLQRARSVLEVRFAPCDYHTVRFTWEQRSGFSFPPVEGQVAVRRFGPVAYLTLQARYLSPRDVATRLFEQAVGERLVRGALEKLFHGIQVAVRGEAPRHVSAQNALS